MTLRRFDFRNQPPATPATPATKGPNTRPRTGTVATVATVARGDCENQQSRFGAQADADALTLAVMIDDDPHVSLDVMRARAGAAGIIGNRWAFGLVALPEAHNGRRAPPC